MPIAVNILISQIDPAYAKAAVVAAACSQALGKLDLAGAFDAVAPSRVDIVHKSGVWTHADRSHSNRRDFNAPMAVAGKSWIEVGADLLDALPLTQGEAAKLIAAGAAADAAVTFILAHEIHHLSESRRVSRCQGTLREARSLFAGALDERLPKDVIALLRFAADRYADHERTVVAHTKRVPVAVAKAHDVAVELRADLGAAFWTREANLWNVLEEAALLATRLADQNIDPPSRYQIGTEMANFAPVEKSADLDGATLSTLFRCVEILRTAPAVDPEVARLAAAIKIPFELGKLPLISRIRNKLP